MSEKEYLERAYNAWTAVLHYQISLKPSGEDWSATSNCNEDGEPSEEYRTAIRDTPVRAVEALVVEIHHQAALPFGALDGMRGAR